MKERELFLNSQLDAKEEEVSSLKTDMINLRELIELIQKQNADQQVKTTEAEEVRDFLEEKAKGLALKIEEMENSKDALRLMMEHKLVEEHGKLEKKEQMMELWREKKEFAER